MIVYRDDCFWRKGTGDKTLKDILNLELISDDVQAAETMSNLPGMRIM
ncbi:MAG: hypothetical protein K6G45_05555 [Lachnospiraceae bacterium]|nr:hypothetical protein [Lachnospiraceae bacterium]